MLDYVAILVILFVVSAVCVSGISEPNLEAVNFVHALEGRRLSGSVIKEMKGGELRDILSVQMRQRNEMFLLQIPQRTTQRHSSVN